MAHSSNDSTILIVNKDGTSNYTKPVCCEDLRNLFDKIDYVDVFLSIQRCDYSEIQVIKWVKYLNMMGFDCQYIGNHDDKNREESFVVRNYTADKINGRHFLATHTGIRYLYTPLFRDLVSSFLLFKSVFNNNDKSTIAKAVCYSHFKSKGLWDATFNWFKTKSSVYYNESPNFEEPRTIHRTFSFGATHVPQPISGDIDSPKAFNDYIEKVLKDD